MLSLQIWRSGVNKQLCTMKEQMVGMCNFQPTHPLTHNYNYVCPPWPYQHFCKNVVQKMESDIQDIHIQKRNVLNCQSPPT